MIVGLPHGPGCVRSEEAARITRFKEELRQATTRDYGLPRRIYDTVAAVYPEAAMLVPFTAISRIIQRWRNRTFPLSSDSLVALSLQLANPRNAGIFNYDAGTITKRIFRDQDGDMHFLFYDENVVTRVTASTRTLMIDFTYKTCPQVPDANLQLGTVMFWRQFYLNDISGLEMLTISSNMIGEYYELNLDNILPVEIDEVMELERRFDAARLAFIKKMIQNSTLKK
uniref:Uncharacterized protein n=1 Tax=Trichogramma kaykai TaxID=54128 RepID=A0ABD2WGV9_9HYME